MRATEGGYRRRRVTAGVSNQGRRALEVWRQAAMTCRSGALATYEAPSFEAGGDLAFGVVALDVEGSRASEEEED